MIREPTDKPGVDDVPDRLLGGLSGLFVDDAEDVFQAYPEGFRLRPSGERLGDRVHVGDEAIGVRGQDRVADGGEHHLIPSGGFRARRLVSLSNRVRHKLRSFLGLPGV